jgi:AcrR family transcriptional regulator
MSTRQAIIDATEKVIRDRGLARATTKEIARAAGVAEGTIFKHFEKKDDLLLAVVQERLPDLAAVASPERAGALPLRRSLAEIVGAALVYYGHLIPPTIAFFADAELLGRHRAWIKAENAGPRRLYELVAAYVAAEQRLGRVDRRRDPVSVAALLLGPAYHYALLRHFIGDDPLPRSDADFVAGLVETLVGGLAPPAGAPSPAARRRPGRVQS